MAVPADPAAGFVFRCRWPGPRGTAARARNLSTRTDGDGAAAERNRREAKVRWRFTTEDARVKLEKLYPVIEYVEEDPQRAAKKG